MMLPVILRQCRIFDGVGDALTEPADVLVADGVIKEISPPGIAHAGAVEIDVAGRVLMPGLIDAHVHVFSVSFRSSVTGSMPLTLMTALALPRIRQMLDRGFTSVRDVSGGDVGIRTAVERGLVTGPRLFVGGPGLTQTGGHGDQRPATDSRRDESAVSSALAYWMRIVDSPDEVRLAVREELRKGADHIKVMASGGVGSPSDDIDNLQFSQEELKVAVSETRSRGKYVCAHAYTIESIRHCLAAGVRSIEHANYIDAETAALVARENAYVVPTLVCFEETAAHGDRLGLSDKVLAKLNQMNDVGIGMLDICERAGVSMGFGTDLVAEMGVAQSKEFGIRARVQRPADVLRSATSVNAEILQMSGKLGVVAPEAFADLIVVDGNPLENIELLGGQGENIPLVMKGGQLHRNKLPTTQTAERTYSAAS
jgi:imidazolonepropionase-like amidohydrolase